MRAEKRVLLVTPTRVLNRTLVPSLQRAGLNVQTVKTFEGAKAFLTDAPSLVITELKLGEYNGLQLALRARADGIPTIVIAEDAFASDVERLGATWLPAEDVNGDELVNTVNRVLQEAESMSLYQWCGVGASTRAAEPLDDAKPISVVH